MQKGHNHGFDDWTHQFDPFNCETASIPVRLSIKIGNISQSLRTGEFTVESSKPKTGQVKQVVKGE